ncbi:uncharacterized protein B0I36DRAFT_288807 [Microdochium trichocladiopsis]|uniref:ferric-chelate reductase (NADPH) n=1 Tax=Microdochium trichocladiopsis TaxID=1682393 RepID=A0A9P9BU19_9PEZI|nr:uncharacterized protein B0I36DRAFT_288807 [Microdochium trichocladiopsis]KAH7031024.1 hypothetical protein B0I36DRAFT_288807 [Microdochium trichocladiopsis]
MAVSKARLRRNGDVRYFLKAPLPAWLSGQSIVPRYEVAIFLVFFAANGLYVAVNNRSSGEATKRLGSIAMVNLVAVSTGAHMNQLVSSCGISPGLYHRLHTCIGLTLVVEATAHIVLQVRQGLEFREQLSGIVAASLLGATFIVSALQRRLFEVFSTLHTAFALGSVAALWLHLPATRLTQPPRVYLLATIALFVFIKVQRALRVAYRSLWRDRRCDVDLHQSHDVVQIDVHLTRPMEVRAGQFLYLTVLGFSTFSFLESHPFQICWTETGEGGRQDIVVLARPRRGFTLKASAKTRQRYRALVDGPYGTTISLGQYGTVLLFATDVGIAGQLTYVRELLRLYQQCMAKSRRIALYWELEAEEHRFWVKEWMNEMLALDTDYILDIRLFIRGDYLSQQTSQGTVQQLGSHNRITLTYTSMDPESIIQTELSTRKGRTLVSLCTNPKITRAVLRGNIWADDVDVKRLDFQPWSS